jgi:hypothetical protein
MRCSTIELLSVVRSRLASRACSRAQAAVPRVARSRRHERQLECRAGMSGGASNAFEVSFVAVTASCPQKLT